MVSSPTHVVYSCSVLTTGSPALDGMLAAMVENRLDGESRGPNGVKGLAVR